MAMPVHTRLQKLRQLPPGRARVAASNVARVAYPLGYLQIRPYVDGVLDRAREYVRIRALRFGQIQARGDGRAGKIDRKCDVRVGFIHDTAKRFVNELPGSEEAEAGERILRRYFPRGLRAVVQAPYEEELIQLQIMVDGLSGPDAELARVLTVEHHVAVLRDLTPLYEDALKYQDKITPGELADAWQAVHRAVIELFCAIVFVVDEEHQADVLAPILDQDDRLAAIYARRRSGQAVEDVDLDEEVAEIIEGLTAEDPAPEADGVGLDPRDDLQPAADAAPAAASAADPAAATADD